MFILRITQLIAITQILLNLIFITPLNVKIIFTTGGPMGYGLLLLPITISLFIFSISAFMYSIIVLKKIKNQKVSLLINGFIFILIILFICKFESSVLTAIKLPCL